MLAGEHVAWPCGRRSVWIKYREPLAVSTQHAGALKTVRKEQRVMVKPEGY